MSDDLVQQKIELLAQQKAKSDRIYELLNAPGGFNEHSRKTLKNLEAAITASKRPGYFSYYEPPDQVKAVIRNGEVDRLYEQVLQLQKKIDQFTEKIDGHVEQQSQAIIASPPKPGSGNPSVMNMQQWFTTYGSPKTPASAEMYSSFTSDKKVYGGTTHYAAFRSLSSTMKKGRMTK